MRHRAGRDEIAAAQLNGIDPDQRGGAIEQALEHIVRLGPAGAAIDPDRRRVGEDRLRFEKKGRHAIDAWHHARCGHHRRGRGRLQIGPERMQQDRLEREDVAVAVERQRGIRHVIAAVIVRRQAFAARRHPFDRPADAARRPQHERILGIGVGLHAEPAADIGRDHAQPGLVDAEHHAGQHGAHAVRVLRRGVERIGRVRRAMLAHCRARLERVGREALALEAQFHDMRRPRERRLGRGAVSGRHRKAEIAGTIRPHERRDRRGRVLEIGDGGKRLVVDTDQFRRVARRIRRLGDDEGDALADEAHVPGRERHPARRMGLGPARMFREREGGKPAQAIGHGIGAGEHGEHAGRIPRLRRVD